MSFEFRDTNLIYDLGKSEITYALKNVNLQIKNKGFICIVGPSGCGKSSLLYLMAGLKTATSGYVFYQGEKLNDMSIYKRSNLRLKKFGIIFQRGFLLDYLSVIDNVLVPINSSDKANQRKAEKILDKFGILNIKKKKPYQLSGGQRQRVAIGRALINNPEVILADEPTASLDHKNAFEVVKVLKEYSKNSLVVMATHDKTILAEADSVIDIWDGVIT